MRLDRVWVSIAPAEPSIEEDIDLDLEMEIEPGCMVPDCEEDAQWAALLHTCGHSFLACTDCRLDHEQRTAAQRAKGKKVHATHEGCTARNRDWTWRRL